MTLHRRAAKKDANERVIIDTLRRIGCSVVQLSAKGCPDLLVGLRGRNFLIEIKTDKGKLTPDQITFHKTWSGEIHIARNLEDAIRIVTKS